MTYIFSSHISLPYPMTQANFGFSNLEGEEKTMQQQDPSDLCCQERGCMLSLPGDVDFSFYSPILC